MKWFYARKREWSVPGYDIYFLNPSGFPFYTKTIYTKIRPADIDFS
jgi:hypothetical protein